MFDAFRIKEFDLEPVYASWAKPPLFVGNPKKDLPVDEWLGQIKAGCQERKVPEEYWHKVAQHYMSDTAKERLNELKKVLGKMNGGKYRWSWKKFTIAMRNMGWDIDASAKKTVKVQAKSSGSSWWILRKDSKESEGATADRAKEKEDVQRPAPAKALSDSVVPTMSRNKPLPSRSKTVDVASIASRADDDARPTPSRANTINGPMHPRVPPSRSDSMDSITSTDSSTNTTAVTTVAQAPLWLLNATSALEFLTAEHPRTMSAISAILITVGSLPAIPALSAGAGGAVLASGAAHAVGAIAVSVGTWIKAQQDGQIKVQQTQGHIDAVPQGSITQG